MKKRIFGIKISTLLTVFVCLAVAFAIWMLVNYRSGLNAMFFGAPLFNFLRG